MGPLSRWRQRKADQLAEEQAATLWTAFCRLDSQANIWRIGVERRHHETLLDGPIMVAEIRATDLYDDAERNQVEHMYGRAETLAATANEKRQQFNEGLIR